MIANADYQIRDRESFPYAKEISKPFGMIDQIITWCKSELVHDWRWQVVQSSSDRTPGRYCFFFDNDRDLCAFVMRWC